MSRTFMAALRRANRLMRPAKPAKAVRSMQKALSGLMVKSALAPLAALTPKPGKPRKGTAAKVRSPLGVVLKQLQAARSAMSGAITGARRPAASPRIPKGAQYLTRRHRCAAGSRTYRVYLPASQPQRPKGLILMLHGCNQTPDDFAIGTHMNALAERHGLVLAYPAQAGADNAASCWNWFKPGDQRRGAGEPALLAALTRKLMKEFGLGRDEVFVAGLSAGGAMAAILADVYPDVFAAAGLHSGLARGAAQDVISAMSAMRTGDVSTAGAVAGLPKGGQMAGPVRRIIFQGDADTTVHPSNAMGIVAAALGGSATPIQNTRRSVRGRGYVRSAFAGPDGAIVLELWMLTGAGHAWSGGRAAGSYTDIAGPDASAQMVRFFLAQAPAA